MIAAIEIGKNGKTVCWKSHILTAATRSLGQPAFEFEPCACPAEASAFVTLNTGSSITWNWVATKRVEVVSAENQKTIATFYPNQVPELTWKLVPENDDLELTFFGENEALACVKLEPPDAAHFGKSVHFGPIRNGHVTLRLLQVSQPDAFAVQLLGFKHEGYRRVATFRFPKGQPQLQVPISRDFFGFVAVVKTVASHRQLVAYADCDGDLGRVAAQTPENGMNDREFQKLRSAIVETTQPNGEDNLSINEWLNNWPSGTKDRFRNIYAKASESGEFVAAEIVDLLTRFPLGLFRYLTLVGCGFRSSSPRQMIAVLNEGQFDAALRSTLPQLAGALGSLTAPEEQVWAVSHAANQDLAAAATATAGQGLSALNRILHLLNQRRAAVRARVRSQATANAVGT